MPEENSLLKEAIEKIEPASPEGGFGKDNLEKPQNPEQALEKEVKPEKTIDLSEVKTSAEISGPGSSIPVSGQRQEQEKQVENILEKNLANIYMSLSPDKRQAFKAKGEETTRKIVDLMDKGKAKAREIMKLIKKWLSMLPGVNRFFIEQEAKIKTDEIINIKNI